MTGLIAIHSVFPANVRAFMSTREGGLSPAPWDSLNLGLHVGDEQARVQENRRRLLAAAGASAAWPCSWMRQVHQTRVVGPDLARVDAGTEADACWSDRPRQICLIQVADCLPILLALADGSAVAACHAGWRGLCEGVIEATVNALPQGEKIAWLGPAIGADVFEVGAEVRAAFTSRAEEAGEAFNASVAHDGRYLADLCMLARQRLARLGVQQVQGGDECSFSQPERYFSYRRDGVTGRMAALIWREQALHPC